MEQTSQTTKRIRWTSQDSADNARLVREMQEDAKWQLQLFMFAMTGTAAILSLAAQRGQGPAIVPSSLVFLAPLFILIPASIVILNRARARNRKAAFIFASLDCKRLLLADADIETMTLDQVRSHPYLPWETALHLLERMKNKKDTTREARPHLSPALMGMIGCCIAMELVSLSLAYWVVESGRHIGVAAIVAAAIVYTVLVGLRCRALWNLFHRTSIQGYAIRWLDLQYPGGSIKPPYLRSWAEACRKYTHPQKRERLKSVGEEYAKQLASIIRDFAKKVATKFKAMKRNKKETDAENEEKERSPTS